LCEEINNKVNNPMAQQSNEGWSYKPTAVISSYSPKTEMKEHPAHLGVIFGQHRAFPSQC